MWLPRLLVLLLINKPDYMLNTFDIITLRKIAWGGDKQTDRQTDIATYRLNRTKGQFSENQVVPRSFDYSSFRDAQTTPLNPL